MLSASASYMLSASASYVLSASASNTLSASASLMLSASASNILSATASNMHSLLTVSPVVCPQQKSSASEKITSNPILSIVFSIYAGSYETP